MELIKQIIDILMWALIAIVSLGLVGLFICAALFGGNDQANVDEDDNP